MGLAILIVGLILFIGSHVFTALRAPRQQVIERVGENVYKAVYSLISVIGIVLIAYGYARYRAAEWTVIWNPPAWTRHVTALLVWPAMIAAVAAYSPGRIKVALKHPLLVGTKLWAVAHLISNGDLGSIVLFGSVLAWAVFDRITLKRRTDPGAPPIPVGGATKDVIAVIGGTVLYFVLAFWFHPYVIGVPAF